MEEDYRSDTTDDDVTYFSDSVLHQQKCHRSIHDKYNTDHDVKKPTTKVVHTIVKRLHEDKDSSSSECSHYDTEGEITEVIVSPQVTEGKFFEFTSGSKPVHIKICRPKDVTSCESDDKVSASKPEKGKKWQMKIRLQSAK